MTPNLLKILWFLLPLCGLLAALFGWAETEPPANWSLVALLLPGLLCWLYLTVRLLSFHKRLFKFLRLLLAGDYEAGIRSRMHFSDEISELETLANQLADRLQTYDRLRADRVSIYSRALELIVTQVSDPLIIAHVEKENFTFNPPAQKRLGITRKNFSFESVLNVKTNEPFRQLFDRTVTGQKTNTRGKCPLQLPGMQSPVQLSLLLMPLRDPDETVRFAILTIES